MSEEMPSSVQERLRDKLAKRGGLTPNLEVFQRHVFKLISKNKSCFLNYGKEGEKSNILLSYSKSEDRGSKIKFRIRVAATIDGLYLSAADSKTRPGKKILDFTGSSQFFNNLSKLGECLNDLCADIWGEEEKHGREPSLSFEKIAASDSQVMLSAADKVCHDREEYQLKEAEAVAQEIEKARRLRNRKKRRNKKKRKTAAAVKEVFSADSATQAKRDFERLLASSSSGDSLDSIERPAAVAPDCELLESSAAAPGYLCIR